MSFGNFTDLKVYKKCRIFRKWVSKIVKQYFPKNEQYLLTAQILDASRSITANIAEGYGRHYYQDNMKFCRYSKGSLAETLEHLITAFDENYISTEILEDGKKQHDECMKLLNGYINYLEKSKSNKK